MMALYFFSSDCRSIDQSQKAMVEAFVRSDSQTQAEAQLKAQLREKKQVVREIHYCESVDDVPIHDVRLYRLSEVARECGFACLISPY